MPSPGLGTIYLATHLTRWARRWAPSLLLLAGAALEAAAMLLPGVGVGLGWIGAVVLALPLLAGRPAPEQTGDTEPSEIHPPGAV